MNARSIGFSMGYASLQKRAGEFGESEQTWEPGGKAKPKEIEANQQHRSADKGNAHKQSKPSPSRAAKVSPRAEPGLRSPAQGMAEGAAKTTGKGIAHAVGSKLTGWSPELLRKFILTSKMLGNSPSGRMANVGMGAIGGAAGLAGLGAASAMSA